MFSFANPVLLYLLLLIPVTGLLFFLAQSARVRKLKKYGKLATLAPLMPDASRYKPWVKITLQLLAIAALVIVLARPRAGAKEETSTVHGIEVMICVDVSNSMLASSTDDVNGVSRLQRAKFILEKLIDKLGNDKVGLIVFAGDAYTQLPITSDFVSAKMFLNSIDTNMVPTQGTAIGSAISMAMNSFTPDEEAGKAIIILTDGENFEDDALGMAREAHKRGIQVDVIGLGSPKGAPIPIDASKGIFLKDDSGKPVTTYLNEMMAQDIAAAADGVYVSGASPSAVSDIDNRLKTLASAELERVVYAQSAEQFPVFAWLALALLIADIFILDRKIGWLKKINFFTKGDKR